MSRFYKGPPSPPLVYFSVSTDDSSTTGMELLFSRRVTIPVSEDTAQNLADVVYELTTNAEDDIVIKIVVKKPQ